MKKAVLTSILSLAATAAWARAYFAPQGEMISNAQVIAVVDIRSVATPAGLYEAMTSSVARVESREQGAKLLFPYKVATGIVETVLKGDPRKSVSFRVPTFFPCAVTEVHKGRHLVFLSQADGALQGNNWHYAYRPISDDRTEWYESQSSLRLVAMPLSTVIRQVTDAIQESEPPNGSADTDDAPRHGSAADVSGTTKIHPVLFATAMLLFVASCTHVYRQSAHDRRVGHPWMHAISCALIAWPLSYLYWLFLWPGTLRQKVFGSDEAHARKWAERKLRKT